MPCMIWGTSSLLHSFCYIFNPLPHQADEGAISLKIASYVGSAGFMISFENLWDLHVQGQSICGKG